MKVSQRVLLLLIVLVICMLSCPTSLCKASINNNMNSGKIREDLSSWKEYSNDNYKISLKYPPEWKINKEYIDRYDGKDGFFQVAALSTSEIAIDKVAEGEAYHPTKPYGSKPKIIKVKLQDEEGRLILPSDDQVKEMNNQAGLIVKYPKPITVGNNAYNYLVIWADKNHINEIARTIKFLYN